MDYHNQNINKLLASMASLLAKRKTGVGVNLNFVLRHEKKLQRLYERIMAMNLSN